MLIWNYNGYGEVGFAEVEKETVKQFRFKERVKAFRYSIVYPKDARWFANEQEANLACRKNLLSRAAVLEKNAVELREKASSL